MTERLTPPCSSWLDEVRHVTLKLTNGATYDVSVNQWSYVSDEDAENDPRDSFVDVPPIDRIGGSLLIRRVGKYAVAVANGTIKADACGLTEIERQLLSNPGGLVRERPFRAVISKDLNPVLHMPEHERRVLRLNNSRVGIVEPQPAAV